MTVTYDQQVNILRILFNDEPIEESDEEKPGVIFDYDRDGNVVGIEILDAKERIENPTVVDYAMVGAGR
jgi:uncharacterized protein YuzE